MSIHRYKPNEMEIRSCEVLFLLHNLRVKEVPTCADRTELISSDYNLRGGHRRPIWLDYLIKGRWEILALGEGRNYCCWCLKILASIFRVVYRLHEGRLWEGRQSQGKRLNYNASRPHMAKLRNERLGGNRTWTTTPASNPMARRNLTPNSIKQRHTNIILRKSLQKWKTKDCDLANRDLSMVESNVWKSRCQGSYYQMKLSTQTWWNQTMHMLHCKTTY